MIGPWYSAFGESVQPVRPAFSAVMINFTGSGWDDFGNLVTAIGLVALLAYLAPGMMSLSPMWARRLQIVAVACLTVALVLAVIASVAWHLR
jgi:hypothetical protein